MGAKLTPASRQRVIKNVRFICFASLLLYAAIVLSSLSWAGGQKKQIKATLKLVLLRPSYCPSSPPAWLKGSTSAQDIADSGSLSSGVAVSRGAEAAAAAFVALHQRAEQDIQVAEAIWRSHSAKQNQLNPIVHHEAHLNFTALLSGVESYPQNSSFGRGIVMVSGGPKYTPPAYGNIVFLRRCGCRLPVEIWTPPHEPIPAAVAAEFMALGNVTVRSLDIYPASAHDAMRSQKFLAKQLAILASQFQEILFLDADNIPLRDPTFLFEEPLYKSGLLIWPDFWSSEVKGGGWQALGIPASQRPRGSHEAGQVVLDKHKAWKPLLLAIYLNMLGGVFYPLLSDNGQGDKETLPMAWLALGYGDYGLVPHPVLALGKFMPDGSHAGRAMMQRSPDGVPLFLHVHFPKIDVPREELVMPPDNARTYLELHSEVSVLPTGFDKASARSYKLLNAVAGIDVEAAILQLRQYLGCQPTWVTCCLQ